MPKRPKRSAVIEEQLKALDELTPRNPSEKYLFDQVEVGLREHRHFLDANLHNYGTISAIAAATVATIVPDPTSRWFSGAAAVIVGGLRGLDFGARWRWHVRMRYRYVGLLDEILRLRLSEDSDGEDSQSMVNVFTMLAEARKLESEIPGIDNSSNVK